MKRLFLIRHAKSSWSEAGLADHARSLSTRGLSDIERMFPRFIDAVNELPRHVIASDAQRTRSTAECFAHHLSVEPDQVALNHDLYAANLDCIHGVIKTLPNNSDCAAMVGHNPGFTDAANKLTDNFQIDNLPTCGIVGIAFAANNWNEIDFGDGSMIYFDYPKNHADPLVNSIPDF